MSYTPNQIEVIQSLQHEGPADPNTLVMRTSVTRHASRIKAILDELAQKEKAAVRLRHDGLWEATVRQ